jgi:hypothetical protein
LYLTAASKITVYPVTLEGPVTLTVSATKDSTPGVPHFSVVSLERTGTETVPATGTREVSEKASGVITITNTYTSSPQRLIANTRFQSTDGKVYRIQDEVVVPGKTSSAPGTLDVTVYADAPGEAYNAASGLEFTLPGLTNPAQHSGITAKQKSAISGGFSGVRATANDADVAAAKQKIEERLTEELRDLIVAQVPAGSILLPGASEITFAPYSSKAGEEGKATIEIKGSIRAIVFENTSLARMLAETMSGTYAGEAITIKEGSPLSLQHISPEFFSANEASFAFSGNATLIYTLDTEAVREAVAGQSKESVKRILDGIPGVKKADVTLRPFWQSVFPEDAAKIQVSVKTP